MRIRTRYLCAYIALTDIGLCIGAKPFTQTALRAVSTNNRSLLYEILAINIILLLLVLGAMAASTIVQARLLKIGWRKISALLRKPAQAPAPIISELEQRTAA